MEDRMKDIGESLYRFQAAINQNGITLEDFIRQSYLNKWLSDELFNVMAIRTTLVNSINQFCVKEADPSDPF